MLLSETELRAALEPLLDRLLTERLRLFQLQIEPRLQSLIAAALQPTGHTAMQRSWQQLLQSRDPNQCFEAVFQHCQTYVGPARALLVVRHNQAVVWKQERMELPERFSLASRQLELQAGRHRSINVRGRTVGLLYWSGGELETAANASLELLLQTAELILLSHGLPPPATLTKETVATPAPPVRRAGPARPADADPHSAAQRFARLLIEDLALYLERERPREWASFLTHGDWQRHFPAELERSRRAFLDRFPTELAANTGIWEEELSRLSAA